MENDVRMYNHEKNWKIVHVVMLCFADILKDFRKGAVPIYRRQQIGLFQATVNTNKHEDDDDVYMLLISNAYR